MTLLEKARAGRIAALASLNTRTESADNVVSIFDFEPNPQPRKADTPSFRSVRLQGEIVRLAA